MALLCLSWQEDSFHGKPVLAGTQPAVSGTVRACGQQRGRAAAPGDHSPSAGRGSLQAPSKLSQLRAHPHPGCQLCWSVFFVRRGYESRVFVCLHDLFTQLTWLQHVQDRRGVGRGKQVFPMLPVILSFPVGLLFGMLAHFSACCFAAGWWVGYADKSMSPEGSAHRQGWLFSH